MARRQTSRHSPLLAAITFMVGVSMLAMILIDRSGPASTVLFSLNEDTNVDDVFQSTLEKARHDLKVQPNGFELHDQPKAASHAAVEPAPAPIHRASPIQGASANSQTFLASEPVSRISKEQALMKAASDLEHAAALEAAAGGMGTGQAATIQQRLAAPQPPHQTKQQPHQMKQQPKQMQQQPKQHAAPAPERQQQMPVVQQQAPSSIARPAGGPMSDKDAREAMNSFFDQRAKQIKATLPGAKDQTWKAEAKETMSSQAAEIKELEHNMDKYVSGKVPGAQSEVAGSLKKALFGDGALKAAAASLAKDLMPRVESRNAGRGQEGRAFEGIYRAAAPEKQVRALGVPLPTNVEQAKLPGVNVADWMDPRVEKALQTKEYRAAHGEEGSAGEEENGVAGYMEPAEGGSQLASFALPPPPKAAPPPPVPAKCPPCGFLPDCQLNPAAVGYSRASGLKGIYPANRHQGHTWGSGVEGAHTSTLRSMGGISQGEPLWNKLSGAFSSRRLLEEDGEGGSMQELASFALPPPPKAAPPPPPAPVVAPPPKCVCPMCKLGDERVGFDDETHTKLQLNDADLLKLMDEELMRTDPHYAEARMDEGLAQYPVVKHGNPLWPEAQANPLSDFNDEDPRPWTNQVKKKTAKAFW